MSKYVLIVSIIIFLSLSVGISNNFAPFPIYSSDLNQPGDDDKDNFKMKMTSAWVRYSNDDFLGALRIYLELYKNHADDPMLNYRMGECYFALKQMVEALPLLEKASLNDTIVGDDLYLLLGQSYQSTENLDKAIESYTKYKEFLETGSPILTQAEKHYTNILLNQCTTAKELMNNPVDVEIKNMGEHINSAYTDACPSVSADGLTLIFTSRRPETTGGKIDLTNEEYYDDVYISIFDKGKSAWSKAASIGDPINTDGHDANLSITADGNQILIYRNVVGETKSGDIYLSEKKEGDKWSKPRPFSSKYINTTYFESSACLSPDGNTLYFVSEREFGGYGSGDIYKCIKEGKEWGKPINLGPAINSVDDEIGVYVHPDGKTMFFSSDGHNTMGGHDIFVSVNEDGNWSKPVNLGYPINTTKEEIHLVMTADRKTAYISSSRDGGLGKMDIYSINMTKYKSPTIKSTTGMQIAGTMTSILRGSVVDAESSASISATISVKDVSSGEIKTVVSNESGEYSISLPADVNYEVSVEKTGYKPLKVNFLLPVGEGTGAIMTKHLLLNKK